MSRARPSPDDSPRRALVIEAARRAFARSSYESVGLRDVAAAAGLDLSQIVREFGAKKELFAAALDDAFLKRPAVSFDGWPEAVANEIWGGEELACAELFGIVACSAASPEVSELIALRSKALLGRIEANLAPGPDLAARASVGAAMITGVLIARRLLNVGGNRADDARFARERLSQMFRFLQVGPAGQGDCTTEGVGAGARRAAILEAAAAEFSSQGYDHATVRNIARAARIDPAQVIRSFNSKQDLFVEVLRRHFRPVERQTPKVMMLNTMVVDAVMGVDGGRELDITLRSASSPVARELLRRDIEERFVEPNARFCGGPQARVRGVILTAAIMGAYFCRTIIRLEPTVAEAGKIAAHTQNVLRLLLDHRGAR